MSSSDRRVIALGNLAGELKTSLEAAARTAGLELLLTREPARAFVELERDGALAVLVDMATLGAEQFCKRARGTERLRSVPVIGMSRHPNELGFARVFAWGADDLVPLGARVPLERRLLVLRDTPTSDASGFGQAVVAEATTQRRALVGRVLAQAGYDVKFAVDRGAVELYASQSETRLVVISAALGDPRRIIEAAAKAGALPTWIVTVEARSTARLATQLAGLDRVAVTSTAGSPEDVLFLANELVFSKGARRREWRALYATPVAFRPTGGDSDEYGFSYDASPRGLYVRSLLPCATDEVEVELRLPNRDERVRLSGKVAKRFAFGSGAIASAPPGFSVHLEGPDEALQRWIDACGELIAAASQESLPPRPRSPSQPVLQSPGLGAMEVALAVPPATISIESVVAPLPVPMQTTVEEGSDVGELLAATLDEQTLAQVGTRPVTIDRDGGVREERPSEFGVSLAPMPIPSAPPAEPAPVSVSTEPARTLGGTLLLEPLPKAEIGEPPSPRSTDWESDAKTAVRGSQPNLGTAPTEAPPPAPPSPEPAPPEPIIPAAPPAPAFAATLLAPPRTPARVPAAASTVPATTRSQEAPLPSIEVPRSPPAPPARSVLQAPSIKQTLPMGMPKQEAPQAEPAPPRAAPRSPAPAAPAPKKGRALLFVFASIAATGVGMAAAFGVHHDAPGGARPATPPTTTTRPLATPAAVARAASTANAAAPIAATAVFSAGKSSPAPVVSSVSSAPSVSSTAPAVAGGTSAATAVATTAPDASSKPTPSVDVSRLAADRAALIVHSTATTHVFVHGTDYGETNQVLMTTCGIRFVRLGQKLGDFIEPGAPRVIKCGRLNELTIEPSP